MKKNIFLSLSLLIVPMNYVLTLNDTIIRGEKHILLESKALEFFDGTSIGVNANTLEMIGLIRREINKVLIGERQQDGTYRGLYEFGGKRYSVKQLAELEQQKNLPPEQAEDLHNVFKIAREDIKKNFRPFMASARNTKHHMVKLVEESCRKRDKMDSFLLNWAEQKVGHEEEGFDLYISDAAKLSSFCVDLLNFLGDLVRSCPNAQKLFVYRVKKFKKINQILPKVLQPIKNNKLSIQKAFMHYLKEYHVDNLEVADITQEKLENLLQRFMQNKR